jgi:hypothetical protein
MNGYIVSVLMGLAVGVAYGHVQVRSSRWSAYWSGRRGETPLRAAYLLRIFRAEATATWQEAVAAA